MMLDLVLLIDGHAQTQHIEQNVLSMQQQVQIWYLFVYIYQKIYISLFIEIWWNELTEANTETSVEHFVNY